MYSAISHHSPPSGMYQPSEDRVPLNSGTTHYPSLSSHDQLSNPYSDEHQLPNPYSHERLITPTSASYGLKEMHNTPPNTSLPKANFEKPDWKQLVLHVFMCLASYPVMYAVTLIAKDRTLFLVRVVVSVGSAMVGFCLAFSLAASATKYLEAASEIPSDAVMFCVHQLFS